MPLTPLTVLGELILAALTELRSASPSDVIARIEAMPRYAPTAEDLAADPDHPDRPMWRSRLYVARRHLGDDDLVVVERGKWTLTQAAQAAVPAPGDQPVHPRTPMQPSVIAAP